MRMPRCQLGTLPTGDIEPVSLQWGRDLRGRPLANRVSGRGVPYHRPKAKTKTKAVCPSALSSRASHRAATAPAASAGHRPHRHGFYVPSRGRLAAGVASRYACYMRLLLDSLPPSLRDQADTLRRCLEAFDRVMPLTAVYLFGSHVRGEAGPDSDVDLCIVSEGAEHQLDAAARFRRATRDIRPKPAFTLVPIAPARLREKRQCGDHFFRSVLEEGVLVAS